MSSSLKWLLLLNLIIIILSQPQICFDYCAPNGCNCYKIFGVGTNAPLNEIKQIYRALSFQYHPDVNPGKDTNAQFAQIASCYEILKDSRSRAQYNDCMRYDQSHYVPKSNHDSLLSLAIPIISILVNIFRRRGAQGEQAGQATSIWKKILKGVGYIIVPIVLYFGIFGEYTFFIVLIGMWSKGLIKKTVQKIWSFVNKGSIEDEIKNFLTELRKALDMNQERIDQELSRKRKAKEDEINLGKNQEMEILQRYHNENVSFIGGKPEDKEENDETRALLKSEKEVELEKTLNRNIQLCESRYSEKIKKLEEDFNGFVEKYKRNFESYREFISEFEKDIEIKIKEKKASRKELKEELQVMKKALETKLMAGEKIEQKDDKKE